MRWGKEREREEGTREKERERERERGGGGGNLARVNSRVCGLGSSHPSITPVSHKDIAGPLSAL